MRPTREEKADRLVREGRVDVVLVAGEEQWRAVVEGEHDTYLVERTPEGRFCECHYGAERGCSHYIAASAAVAGVLAGSNERGLV